MRIAISGTRDVAPRDLPLIESYVGDILAEGPDEMLFGGARGADTVALAAACTTLEGQRPPMLTVIVPKRLKDQPVDAQEWAKECADEILELKAERLNPEAYRRRNRELISRADALVAFWDGESGGTGMTISLAREAGIPVEIVRLGESARLGAGDPDSHKPTSAFDQPWRHWLYRPTTEVQMPVITLGLYMSAVEGLDRLSQFVRATKAGTVRADETRYWASVASNVISARPELADAVAIVPVPRRIPNRPNDLAAFTAQVAVDTGKVDGTGFLVRVEEPTGGEVKARRERFPAPEHGRTMAVDPEHPLARRLAPGSKVILLDNVLTYGGTLEGARQVLARDFPGVEPIGLALLVSGDYAIG
jgi:hypothetical protein